MDLSFHGTTVLAVRRGTNVVIGGDGQVTLGETVMKAGAKKVRRMMDGRIIGGFAGSAADGMALFERLESKLKETGGQLPKAAVELAKEWRMDRAMRRLEALLLLADKDRTLMISGTGDVIEPDDGAFAIGSGAGYALTAARALLRATSLSSRDIVQQSLQLASEICIYTNAHFTFEEIV